MKRSLILLDGRWRPARPARAVGLARGGRIRNMGGKVAQPFSRTVRDSGPWSPFSLNVE